MPKVKLSKKQIALAVEIIEDEYINVFDRPRLKQMSKLVKRLKRGL